MYGAETITWRKDLLKRWMFFKTLSWEYAQTREKLIEFWLIVDIF